MSGKHPDPTASSRKQDHIELAFQSQVSSGELDRRFYYEPVLSEHPDPQTIPETTFLGKTLRIPVWVSSMTGGTKWAGTINRNLARACREFGMGMGLGSCRSLLTDDDYLPDFDVRDTIGEEQLLFANLGIAQLEELIREKAMDRIQELIGKLRADGLIIHINPIQEWLQPEGDRFEKPPVDTISYLLENLDIPLIVKEVGQGMGPDSLKTLMQLPLAAVDFAASGGTNFALLELLRSNPDKLEHYESLAYLGHSAEEMVLICNELTRALKTKRQCDQLIISGGVKHFLDGYYLIQKSDLNAIYGQASGFLRYAKKDYAVLKNYINAQVKGLALCYAMLRIR